MEENHMTEKNQLHTIGSSLELLRSSEMNFLAAMQPLTQTQKAAVAIQLSRLAIHYYRPDFTEGQAKALMQDMVEDLSEFRPDQIENAIRDWRRDPEKRFFPRAAELAQIIRASCKRSSEIGDRARAVVEFGESRPIGWEYLRKQFWKPHWQVSDLDRARDPERRARYEKWVARQQADDAKGTT